MISSTVIDRSATALLLCAMAVCAALILHLGRGLTFFYDEWDWVFHRRSGGVESFLENHNGHLHAVPIAGYRVLFMTVGLRDYVPYRAMVLVVHLACGALVYLYCRRRLASPVALVAAVLVLFLGSAWQNLLWPFQTGFLASIAAGLVVWLMLDGHSARRDIVASAALVGALASSGIGVPILVGVAVELAMAAQWRRLFVLVAPAGGAYGLWTAMYGSSQVELDNLARVPGYVFDAGRGAAAGLGNLPPWGGVAAFTAIILGTLLSLCKRRLQHPRLLGLSAAAGTYWVLTALSRATSNEPAASRYLSFGGIVLLLVTVELARPWGRSVALQVLAVAAAPIFILPNISTLRAGAAGLRDVSGFVRPQLAAVELAGSAVDADLQPDPVRMPQLRVGPYLAAVEDLGSPADSFETLRSRSPEQRTAVDAILVRAAQRGGGSDARGGAAEIVLRSGDLDSLPPSCVRVTPSAGFAELELRLQRASIAATSELTISSKARRFGPEFLSLPESSAPGKLVFAARDSLSDPWQLVLASPAPLEVCSPLGGSIRSTSR